MASYLGKISALVTANVLPFRAALQESNRDLNRWRSQVNSTLNQAASGNWEQKILTKFQQVRQAIAAAQSGQLDFPGFDARKVEQMFSAIEQIQKPLAKARDQFDGLSASVQARFLPALESVQREALLMRDLIEAGFEIDPAGFDDLQRRVDGITASIKRLEELSSKTSGLVSGAEFRFQAPEASAAIDRTRRLQQEAAATFGAGDVQNMALYKMQASLASSLAGTRAEIERVMSEGGDVTALVQREKTFAEALERTNDTLGKRIGLQKQSDDVAKTRAKRADSLDRPFREVIEDRSFNRVSQQISFFGNELARIGVQAGGPVESAFNNLTQAASRFASAGTVGTKANQQELKRLQQELVKTLVDTKELTKAQGRALLRSAGDIGRAGYDKLSLGVQQAAFAVEDFFSVTGGLDQRIRAAGNNISQLGFILGSTTGLFVGIGVAIAAQAIAPLLKLTQVGKDFNDWLESGRNKSDAFRDSIAAQRQAVDDLSASFKRLGESIDSASTSSFGRQAKDTRAQIVSIAEGLRNVRERRIFSADAEVLTADATVKAAENRLSRATTVGEAVAASRELEIAKQAQKTAREAAVRRAERPVDVDAVRQRADADIRAARAEFARSPGGQGSVSPIAVARLREAIAAAEQSVVDAQAARDFQDRRRGADATGVRLGGLLVGGNPVAAMAQGMAGQVGPGEITRRLDEIGRIREELNRSISKAVEDGFDPAVFEQVVINANKMQLALLGAASVMQEFAVVSDSIKQAVSADVGSLEQRAEQARRAAAVGAPGAADRLSEANDTASEARRLRQRADDAVDIARRRVEQGVLAQDFTRLGQIETALQAEGISVDERERLLAERRAIRGRVADTIESDPNVAAARAMQDDATRMAEFAAAADRGRELSMTPSQRAARDLQQQLNDINAFFGMQAEQGSGLVDVDARNKAMARAVADSVRQAAPTLMGFSDEIANARLQGPSRAALAFTDVATMEGSRELNRLLRGDDPSRDVNLVELQRQTELLGGILDAARNFGVPVAD